MSPRLRRARTRCLAVLAALPLVLALLVGVQPAQRADAADPYTGYLMVHFIGEGSRGQQIYFTHSKDGMRWSDLNGGEPALLSTVGTRGVRDPALVRSPAGDRYWIVATDLCIDCGQNWGDAINNGSRNLVVWESSDLVTWSAPRLLDVATGIQGKNAWAPEAIWDPASNAYVIYWASNAPAAEGGTKHQIFYATTTDFRTVSASRPYLVPPAGQEVIDTQIIEAPSSPGGFRYYRASCLNREIVIEGSNSVLGTWTNLGNLARSGFSNGGTPGATNVEGPMWQQVNGEAEWNLWLDQYATGSGYTPATSTNLSDTASYRKHAPADYSLGTNLKRHGSIMSLTAAEESRVLAAYSAPVNRLAAVNVDGGYVRHAGFKGRVAANVSPAEDAQFRIRKGLDGVSGNVSFESVNFPGYFLRHYGFAVELQRNDGSGAFRGDASFTPVAGLSDSSATSYRSANVPDRYLRHYALELRVDPISSAQDRADATFRVVS